MDASKYKKIVVFGDSISTGYGLTNYVAGGSNKNVSNFANAVANKYARVYGKTFYNFAVDGDQSADLLAVIKRKAEIIEDADLILISIGGNDIMIPMFLQLAGVMGIGVTSYKDVPAVFDKILKADTAYTEEFKKNFEENKSIMDSELFSLIDDYSTTLNMISEELKKLAPNAKIVLQTVYNPIDDALFATELMQLVKKEIAEKYIEKLNDVIRKKAETDGYTIIDTHALFKGKGMTYTNIMKMDIHPNALGHSTIAEAIIDAIDK